MNRRDFLGVAGLALAAGAGAATARAATIGPGPHLFLDDFWIERMEGLERRAEVPRRLETPVLDSATFGCTQPYLTVLRDAESGRLRMWYNRGPALWHAESQDGVHWENPRVAWDLPRNYGASLVDDRGREPDPARRFKMASWQATREKEDKPGDDGGMYVGFSPDGFRWRAHEGNPVLPTWPEGYGTPARHGVGDIVDVAYDPASRGYIAAVKVHAVPEDGYVPGPRAGSGIRRLVGLSTSPDFVRWARPRRIFAPDAQDEGLTEFYGMGAMHELGGLRIGFVRVLRDDLPCDPGGPADGIGYSVLATSRDGLTWERRREPFLDRNPAPGTWDHAMSWIGSALPVGDELFLYYGGYARGHKVEPAKERQIGLARLTRDRYLALVPAGEEGLVVTRPFLAPDGALTVNARAPRGKVAVRLLAEDGPIGPAEIGGDVLEGDVRLPVEPGTLRGRAVRLEFRVRGGALFGFGFKAPGG